jgi:hypothetical protein
MTEEIPRGPWDVPLKGYVKEFYIILLIKDIKSDRYIKEEKVNYGDSEIRKWLGRVSYWAWCHGYAIETMSLKDYEEREVS